MSVLIVVAHPDDEILGAGGTASALAEAGREVRACILSGNAEARRGRPGVERLHAQTRAACRIVGMAEPVFGSFPNIAFNTVPHLELVQFIEKVILEHAPTTIITHHPRDLNNDHLHTSHACLAAARLFQRRPAVTQLISLLFMEVLSSTDWALDRSVQDFQPDTFVEIGKRAIDAKLKAMSAYEGVLREYPHPRSTETIKALATLRGSQAGLVYAEAFETVFRIAGPKGL